MGVTHKLLHSDNLAPLFKWLMATYYRSMAHEKTNADKKKSFPSAKMVSIRNKQGVMGDNASNYARHPMPTYLLHNDSLTTVRT